MAAPQPGAEPARRRLFVDPVGETLARMPAPRPAAVEDAAAGLRQLLGIEATFR